MSSSNFRIIARMLVLLLVASVSFVSPATAQTALPPTQGTAKPSLESPFQQARGSLNPRSDSRSQGPRTSHRLIVELNSAPLTVWARQTKASIDANGRLNVQSPAALSYIAALRSEQTEIGRASCRERV